ncbi:MAG TPA: sigma-54 dependent transcriptional regulator [Planctomycetota bacterium]|nr:sigma-54 dependent transcriptional regulator [Planctomycetota bacterium]
MARELIMVLDDQELMRDSLREVLSRSGYRVRAFAAGAEALKALAGGGYDLLITDMKMPNMDGLTVLAEARKIAPALAVVVITAFGTVETAVEAMRRGAFDYIQKPFKPEEIELLVERALERRRLLAENEYLRAEVRREWSPEEMVGREGGLAAVWAGISKVARTPATVLIRGETGTGKELVARAIHYGSDRAARPFVRVNCAALSAGLLESELFGHEKGAFTGAQTERVGRFELAEGGSLLLDEISEMSVDLQGKLLRVLQEREYERVGSSEPRQADVRVIATTNRDLERHMNEGKFRQDLFFRLNVVPINVPPLRERRGDIPALAEHFLRRFSREMGSQFQGVHSGAAEALSAYDWPGNVRELANVIERAAVLHSGSELLREHVEPGLRGAPGGSPGAAPGAGASGPVRSLDDLEREAIIAACRRMGGERRKVAEALGISERTLREKLRKYREEGVAL